MITRNRITNKAPLVLRVSPFLNSVEIPLGNFRIKAKVQTTKDQEPKEVETKYYDDKVRVLISKNVLTELNDGLLSVMTELWVPITQVTKEQDMFTVVNDWVLVATKVTEVGILSHQW